MALAIARYVDHGTCRKELEAMGFRAETVYIKDCDDSKIEDAERRLAGMKCPPMQYAAFNYWGRGAD